MLNPLVTILAVVATSTLLATPQTYAEDNPLIGAWKMVSYEARTTDGEVKQLYGAVPGGLLIYDASGYMSAQGMRLDLPKCGTMDRRMCPEKEARAAFDGYFGYWGRYEVHPSEGVVVHIVEGTSLPDGVGVNLKRFYEIVGDRLTLRTPPQPIRGVEMVGTIVWERIR